MLGASGITYAGCIVTKSNSKGGAGSDTGEGVHHVYATVSDITVGQIFFPKNPFFLVGLADRFSSFEFSNIRKKNTKGAGDRVTRRGFRRNNSGRRRFVKRFCPAVLTTDVHCSSSRS